MTATSPEVETLDEVDFTVLREEISAWMADAGARYSDEIERSLRVPEALWEELRDRGYLRLSAPTRLGGRGLPFAQYLELLELFAKAHGSLRMIVHVSNGIWRALEPYASDEQIERFVIPQIRTDIRVAFTLTEPGAGSGADIKCSVVREGDTYYVSGQKHMITFGHIADYLLLIARLEGTRGSEGLVALMVPAHGEGVDNREMVEGMGLHGTDHSHLTFDRAPVPAANRLGEEGQGLDVALAGFLVPSRISLAMTCVGVAQQALELALAHAQERETFGAKIATRQAIAFRLAEMATDVEAGRRLVLHAAATWERDHGAVAESAMAKLFASQMVQRVTDNALDIFGGMGYFQSPIERVYRDARAQRFEEGTVEIQKMTIARELLG